MTKNYFYIIILFFCFISLSSNAQESKQSRAQDTSIDGLNMYPNPVSNGKVYITSKSGLDKDIFIFDVLGKLVFQINMSAKELNVSALSPGVYIIKIREAEATATRKLIIK